MPAIGTTTSAQAAVTVEAETTKKPVKKASELHFVAKQHNAYVKQVSNWGIKCVEVLEVDENSFLYGVGQIALFSIVSFGCAIINTVQWVWTAVCPCLSSAEKADGKKGTTGDKTKTPEGTKEAAKSKEGEKPKKTDASLVEKPEALVKASKPGKKTKTAVEISIEGGLKPSAASAPKSTKESSSKKDDGHTGFSEAQRREIIEAVGANFGVRDGDEVENLTAFLNRVKRQGELTGEDLESLNQRVQLSIAHNDQNFQRLFQAVCSIQPGIFDNPPSSSSSTNVAGKSASTDSSSTSGSGSSSSASRTKEKSASSSISSGKSQSGELKPPGAKSDEHQKTERPGKTAAKAQKLAPESESDDLSEESELSDDESVQAPHKDPKSRIHGTGQTKKIEESLAQEKMQLEKRAHAQTMLLEKTKLEAEAEIKKIRLEAEARVQQAQLDAQKAVLIQKEQQLHQQQSRLESLPQASSVHPSESRFSSSFFSQPAYASSRGGQAAFPQSWDGTLSLQPNPFRNPSSFFSSFGAHDPGSSSGSSSTSSFLSTGTSSANGPLMHLTQSRGDNAPPAPERNEGSKAGNDDNDSRESKGRVEQTKQTDKPADKQLADKANASKSK